MAFMDKVKGMLGIPEDAEEMYDEDDLMPEEGAENSSEEETGGKTSIFGKAVSGDSKQNKVVNIHTTTQLQVVLVKPERFDDARPVADHLNSKHTVVLNLEATNKEVSRRLIDFLSGVAYANNGQIKRVANSTYIITPYNVNIMGDLLDELESSGVFF
ncbi:MAG: cell division protein SepF [Oscillospiraceae bacterium]|nr:cell division protein SepF [Oscillospiraceae bacterium]MBR3610297.1 cell division protein SepF [Oscillospiraceae bacterium]MBR3952046.1 cell division protein SepF [Oscillospiraceae bacterium]